MAKKIFLIFILASVVFMLSCCVLDYVFLGTGEQIISKWRMDSTRNALQTDTIIQREAADDFSTVNTSFELQFADIARIGKTGWVPANLTVLADDSIVVAWILNETIYFRSRSPEGIWSDPVFRENITHENVRNMTVYAGADGHPCAAWKERNTIQSICLGAGNSFSSPTTLATSEFPIADINWFCDEGILHYAYSDQAYQLYFDNYQFAFPTISFTGHLSLEIAKDSSGVYHLIHPFGDPNKIGNRKLFHYLSHDQGNTWSTPTELPWVIDLSMPFRLITDPLGRLLLLKGHTSLELFEWAGDHWSAIPLPPGLTKPQNTGYGHIDFRVGSAGQLHFLLGNTLLANPLLRMGVVTDNAFSDFLTLLDAQGDSARSLPYQIKSIRTGSLNEYSGLPFALDGQERPVFLISGEEKHAPYENLLLLVSVETSWP